MSIELANQTLTSSAALQAAAAEQIGPLSRDKLLRLVDRVSLPRDEWKRLILFDREQFRYRTLFRSPQLEINLIGWKRGQWSSVHDHRGTQCAVLVLDGTLTNRDYRLDAVGGVVETACSRIDSNEVLSRCDRAIHCCGNAASEDRDLATLHFYSPALPPLSQRRYR